MHVCAFRIFPVLALLAAFLFQECPSAASTSVHPNVQSRTNLQGQSLLYVADSGRNQIDIFEAGVLIPQQLGTITQGIDQPVDIAVDKKGTLFVANAGSTPGTVAVFPAGSTVPSEIITLPARNAYPDRIGVGPHGTTYVVTNDQTSHYFVVEYDPGVISPSRIVHVPLEEDPCCATVQGIAFDSADNMYLNYGEGYLCCGYGILVYAPYALHYSSEFYVGFGFANGAIVIDADDNIFIGDTKVVRVAQIPNHHGYKRSIPTPLTTNQYLALDPRSKFLYTTVPGGIQAYDSNTGKRRGSPITGLSNPKGIAVYPPPY